MASKNGVDAIFIAWSRFSSRNETSGPLGDTIKPLTCDEIASYAGVALVESSKLDG